MNRYTNARLKAYPAKTVMQVASKDIFPLSSDTRVTRPYEVSPPGKAKNPERSLAESKHGQSLMSGTLLYAIISVSCLPGRWTAH